LSEVPHKPQLLHSMHCQGYFLTEMIMLAVNCKHDGCPGEKTTMIFFWGWLLEFRPKIKLVSFLSADEKFLPGSHLF
jgi:hypothetical protein